MRLTNAFSKKVNNNLGSKVRPKVTVFQQIIQTDPLPTKSAKAILNSIGRFASRSLAAQGTNNMQEISD